MAPGEQLNQGVPKGGNKSHTSRTITLGLFGSSDTIQVPVMVCTKIQEVKQMLCERLGVHESTLVFFCRQGAYMTKLVDLHEVRDKMLVKGLSSFSRQRCAYQYPHVVGGAGQGGLRMSIAFLQRKQENFVCIERRERLGGNSWLEWANPQSKVQTELGTYHLNWSEHSPVPRGYPVWPSRDELLRHYEEAVDQEGVRPFLRFNTEIMSMDVITEPGGSGTQHYQFSLRSTGTGERETFMGSSFLYFPGNLTNPRREEYKGEDLFGGAVNYGMFSEADYGHVTGQSVAIVGFGAFAVENIRTCCEYKAKKIFLVCRRKNLCMPRIVSWEINGSLYPLAGALVLRHMEPVYAMIGESPWDYYSVQANSDRSAVTIHQKSRFGIGDVYFLSRYFGACEVVLGSIKRLSKGTIHLDTGKKVEGVSAILKLFGFEGEWEVDKLLQLKEMKGFWINGDHRRGHWSEFPEINAQRFGGTSYSPGIWQASGWFAYMLDYPRDFQLMMAQGGSMIPVHKPDVKNNIPGYVIDAKLGATMMVMIGTILPKQLAEYEASTGPLKRKKQWETHSLKEVLESAAEEWYKYCKMFLEYGYDKPLPDYPFTLQQVKTMVAEGDRDAEAAFRRMR